MSADPRPDPLPLDTDGLLDCIQCGECTSTCPRHRFDPGFNPRKWMSRLRLLGPEPFLADRSLWSCMKCYRCAQVCRRILSPAEELMKMRRLAVARGGYSNEATRHAEAFLDDIRTTGKLNEALLPLKTLRLKVYRLLPMTVRMAARGKLPPLRVEKVDRFESLRDLCEAFGGGKSR